MSKDNIRYETVKLYTYKGTNILVQKRIMTKVGSVDFVWHAGADSGVRGSSHAAEMSAREAAERAAAKGKVA